jgi:hypothetical protein
LGVGPDWVKNLEKIAKTRKALPRRGDEDRCKCKGERLLAIEEGFPGLEISVSPELGWGPEPEFPEQDSNSSPSEESEESPLNGADLI